MILQLKNIFIILTVFEIFLSKYVVRGNETSNIGKRTTSIDETDVNGFQLIKPIEKASLSNSICETPGCRNAASSILKNMDVSVNPCNNFYQFACGNFVKDAVIPNNEFSIDAFSELNNKIENQIRVVLEDEISGNVSRSFESLLNFYKSCMNTENMEKRSENEFKEILKALGGWPVLEGKTTWNASNFDWKQLVYQFRRIGNNIDYFFQFKVEPYAKNMSRRIIVIDQPTFGILQNYLTKGPEHTIVQIYFKFMVDLAEILGAKREEAKTDLTDSLNFEIELAKTVLASINYKKSKPLYKIMTIQELESKYPSIPWLQYINEMLAPRVQVDPSEEFILRMPGFFDVFEKLITATPKRTLSNYALWRMTSQSASFLSDRIRRLDAEFQAAISGYTRLKKPQWLECVSNAVANLPVLVGALYVRRYFDESSKADALEIMHDIIRSFEHRVKQVDWMNNNMRTFALEKLNKIILYVGYPNELMNDEILKNVFESLALKPESYLKNMLSIKRFYTTNKFMNLKKPIVKNNWLHHSFITVPNAQYNFKDKSIDCPAGILQGKFFAKDRPKYLNYGAIGSVMGHELIHAFDDEERQYDKDGKLIELWDNETRQTFIERAQCVIDQYNNFTVQEINMQVEGYSTQVENIADIGGLKQAYYAYKNWQQRNDQEELLPGLSYTPNQMFWIGAANIWCSKMTKEALEDKVFNGRHSPNEFRVIGPMSNNPEFAKDFNCPLRSIMNPIKKCAVW